jgi:hypothetical protein
MDAFVNATLTYTPIPPIIPPEIAGKRGFILHDHQSADTGYQIYREYLPETEKFGDVIFEQMGEARQWFWFNLLKLYGGSSYTDTQIRAKWRYITAGNLAFCNKHGTGNNPGSTKEFWDFINNRGNTDAPAAQENLTTCGNMIILTGNEKGFGGTPFVGFWCLDSLAPMPTNIENHPLLDYFIHAATTITPLPGSEPNFPRHSIAPNGTFIVNHFPALDGRRVPVPVFSARGMTGEIMGLKVRENWLRADRVCPLDDYEMPSPVVR